MEEQLNTMNAILQGMQQALKCNICLDMLNSPLTTKCGHSFCGECVQQLLKRPRGSAQCPLCMGSITRRSLSRNSKVMALVSAVRRVIASIKKDCCFEVTPSKYRPRPRPEAAAEDDDSENEEKDEPRRGTRKRGATALYNPEVVPPRPRPRPAKRRILAANGAQELSLHSEGATIPPVEGEEDLLEAIAQDHSYSSPTKQAPLERPSTAPAQTGGFKPRGKARGGAATSAKASYLGPRKLDEKNGDNLVSASQGNEAMLPGEAVAGAEEPLPHLGQECPKDKVTKWLHNSREVGFRIGVALSTASTPSTPSSVPADILKSSGYPANSSASSGQQQSTSLATVSSTSKKFFKSKEAVLQAATTASNHTTLNESQDTYIFVPSQNTPPRQAPQPQPQRRGRGRVRGTALPPGRARGRGRGLARPSGVSQLSTSGLSVSVRQSTPAGPSRSRPPLDVSVIQAPARESLIVRAHDDGEEEEEEEEEGKNMEEERAELPDSCPVNTLDHFDQLVADAKENNPPRPVPPPTSLQDEEDKEAGLLFVTPAQEAGVESAPDTVEGAEGQGKQGEGEGQKAGHHHHPKKVVVRGSLGGKARKGVRQQAAEEVLGVERLLAGVEDHRLATATPQQEEESRQRRQQQRETTLKQDLSLLNLTLDNTLHNRGLATPPATTTMAPPAPPSGRRRVRFDPDSSRADHPTGKPPKKTLGPKANTRYVSELKQRLVESGRPSPAPVGLKNARSAKSPGWSHVEGARRDLSLRNTSLNITGGEGRLGVEGRGREGALASSVETCLTIEDTQENDVEHLPLSQAKKDRVQRLRDIVSSMTRLPRPTHTPTHTHSGQEGTKQSGSSSLARAGKTDSSTAPSERNNSSIHHAHNTTENLQDTTEDTHNATEDTQNTTEYMHNNNNNTETLHSKNTELSHSKIPTSTSNHRGSHTDTDTDTDRSSHTDSILLGGTRTKKLKLSVQRLIPTVEKMVQEKPYIVKDAERVIASLSPRARHTPQGKPVMRRERELRENYQTTERDRGQIKPRTVRESEKVTPTEENEALAVRESERESHSSKPRAVVLPCTDTEPFLVDGVHSKDIARQKQGETARVSPQQKQQKKPPPQHGKQRDPVTQQGKQRVPPPQQEDQGFPTHTTANKRKQRDPSPQQESQEESTQQLTQQSKQADYPAGKRIKQAATTHSKNTADSPQPPHSTDTNTPKGNRKTFSFSTDTEDLDALLNHSSTARDTQQARKNSNNTAGGTTAPQKDSKRTGGRKMLSLAGSSHFSNHSKPHPPHHSISPSVTSTTATEDTTVTQKQGMASRSLADKVTTASQVSKEGNVTSDQNVTSKKGDVTSALFKGQGVASEEVLDWSGGTCDPQHPPCPSSRVTPGTTEEGQVVRGRAVVPFKAAGRLCSERCIEAGMAAGVVASGALRDLCVHSVPCEVYQVLLRYIGLLSTQPQQHRVCCGKGVQQQQQSQSLIPVARTTVTSSAAAAAAAPSVASSSSSQPHSPCTQAPERPSPHTPKTQVPGSAMAAFSTQVPGEECQVYGESEALFDSEMVHSSCPTQDMAYALPLPLPLPNTAAETAQETGPGRGPSGRFTNELWVPRASQGQEELSEDILLQPVALCGRRGQLATTEDTQESVSLLADCEAEEAPGPREAEQHEGRGPEKAERRAAGSLRTKERVAAARVAEGGEVEKENVQSVGGQPLARDTSLRRKPQKVGRPVLEDILTQRSGRGEVPSGHKASLPPTTKTMFSPDPGQGKGQRGEAPVAVDQARARDRDSEASGPEDGPGRPPRTRLSGRKHFRRIARPPSSGSESEGEVVPAPTPATTQAPAHPASPALTQHFLDSEEMRDLERLDRNVWEEFGRPDDDLLEEETRPPSAGHSLPATMDPTPRSAVTLSASTRQMVEHADRTLAKMEEFLGPDTPSLPALTPTPPSHEVTIVQETDDEEEEEREKDKKTRKEEEEEEEEEEETQSHGSTQSEAISTQKQKQMQDEIEALRRKKEEVMAALGNRKQDQVVETITPSQVESLVSTCPFVEGKEEEEVPEEMEGDQDLFPSNPEGDDPLSLPLSPRQPSPVSPQAPSPPPPPPPPPPCKETQLPVVKRIPRAQLTSTGQGRGRGGAKTKPCVIFSGLGLEERQSIQESLQTLDRLGLGVRRAWGPDVTHVVVQTKNNLAPRTLKYLLGVAAGCWVLSQDWVMDSLARKKLMQEEPYEVLDETGEDGPRRSRISSTHLLEGCQVCVVPPFEDMTQEQVEELAETSGALVVPSPKAFTRGKDTLTLLLLDSEREEEGREMMARHSRVAVGHNWLVDSITSHQLAPFPEHLLGTPSNAIIEASGVPPALMVESQSVE